MKKTILGMIAASACTALCGLTLVACGGGGGGSQGGENPPPDQTEHTHNYIAQVVTPQCFEGGYTRHKCECGAEYTDSFVEALGHDMNDDVCSRCEASATEGLEYASVSGGYEVKGIGLAQGKDLIIPSKHNGSTVVAVGDGAFRYAKGIEYVTLPQSVKTVGEEAFYGCSSLKQIKLTGVEELKRLSLCAENLKKIELPETLRIIGNGVFSRLKMHTLTIPASVEQIGQSVFSGCDFEEIFVAAGNTRYKSVNNCVIGPVTDDQGTRTVLLFGCKNSRIPNDDSFSEIYNYAFANVVGLDELVIPDSIERIGLRVFEDSDMKSLKIGKGLSSISYGVFMGCDNLTKITVDPENETFTAVGNCIINKAKKSVVLGCKASVIPTDSNVVTAIADNAFRECPVPENFAIPANVTKIGRNAFSYSGLKSVTIYGTLTEAKYAFASATSLKNVTFEEGVTKIAENMFSHSSVEQVDLPESITEIGKSAFSLSSLTSIRIPSKVTALPDSVFSDCTALTQVVIPDGITSIGSYAFANCYNLVKVTLGKDVESIGNYAFNNCNKLVELVNLSSLDIQKTNTSDATNFGNLGYALATKQFQRANLDIYFEGEIYTSADYTSKLDFVDGFAFYNNNGSWELYSCGVLGDVTLPTGYKGEKYDVASGAFAYFTPASGVTIKSGVGTVKGYSFYYNRSIERIDLTGVDMIEEAAFTQCDYLKSVSVKNCNSIAGYAVYLSDAIEEIYLENVKTIGDGAFYRYQDTETISKITVAGECDSIGEYAFYVSATKDANVVLSKGIKQIKAAAFYDAGFDTVYFTGTREEWNAIDIAYATGDGEANDTLRAVAVYCYSETAPSGEGNYWHYAADGTTPVKW